MKRALRPFHNAPAFTRALAACCPKLAATDLEHILRMAGITDLLITGLTTDVCVSTTIREANDRGFEVLVLSDCTAATDRARHLQTIEILTMQGGLFAAVASSDSVLAALGAESLPADDRTR